MLRIVLLLILFVIVARVFWRVIDNIIEAASGQPPVGGRGSRVRGGGAPPGIAMARDPICGTFVPSDRAVSIVDGRSRVYFCSNACLDEYRARAGRTA